MSDITTRAGKGSPLTNNEVDANFTNLNTDKIENVVEDTTPQLGGDLDVNGHLIAGRNIATDGTKLDGIESGATADQTAQEIATAIDADTTAESTLKSALGLGTAAYTASTDYATAAQGTLADSALQSIPDNYVLNTGDSITGDLTFGDNNKAIFGAGSDLQIWHDGSTHSSYISESGIGELYLRGTNLWLQNTGPTKTYAKFTDGAGAQFYHNDALKLATTSTGIDVTGTATMDGLTVDGGTILRGSQAAPDEAYLITLQNTSDGGAGINFDNNVTSNFAQIIGDVESAGAGTDDGVVRIRTANNGTLHDSLRIDADGDISFYEDTGTTAKFYWDASTESLGIGTTTTDAKLHVHHPQNTTTSGTFTQTHITLSTSDTIDNTGFTGVAYATSASDNYGWTVGAQRTSTLGSPNAFVFLSHAANAVGTERMRIDSSGKVGIGTTSPQANLHVGAITALAGNLSPTAAIVSDTNTSGSEETTLGIYQGATSVGSAVGLTAGVTNGSNPYFSIKTRPTVGGDSVERMRIDSSGNLLVGTTSGTEKLTVSGNISVSGSLTDGTNSVTIADLAAGGSTPPTIQTFTASGTWTKPTGCKTIKVTVVGGGGGGGNTTTSSSYSSGGGGGGGGTSIQFIDVSAVSSVSVTVGSGGSSASSGGTSSFGAYCSATGGGGGSTGGLRAAAGTGGTGSGGALNFSASGAGAGSGPTGGGGGSSFFGGGAKDLILTSTGSSNGIAASAYGGGGSGAATFSTNAAKTGGAGYQGIVVVEEFY